MILQVEFDLDNGVKMAVNFDKMVQKNKKTGWERPIRIAVKDEKDKSKSFLLCYSQPRIKFSIG